MPPPKKKPRRGGIRQRMQHAMKHDGEDGKEQVVSSLFMSQLVRYLLNDFAWGDMSCQKVRDIAHCALKDLRYFHGSNSGARRSSENSFSNCTPLEKEL